MGTECLRLGVRREVGLEKMYENHPHRWDIDTMGIGKTSPKCVEKRMKAKDRALGNGAGGRRKEREILTPMSSQVHSLLLLTWASFT